MNDVTPSQATGPLEPSSDTADIPSCIDRYQVERLLGAGAFGRVYLARDEELNRRVAIKVPLRSRLGSQQAIEAYLSEARALASLDHPHIVAVYDVGRTADGGCFVVSKFIEGRDLAASLRDSRLSFAQAAALVATIADALHHAHRKGLVHRDVKPGNILIDLTGVAYVTDFGLALREEDFGKGAQFAGTPAYMSPEQAAGQGQWVDGRSDVFSLGVVLYELLTGRRPFRAESYDDLLRQITATDVRPPRQVDDTIPPDLERICLKALARHLPERYTTSKDFADDLKAFLSACATTTAPESTPWPECDGKHCPVCHMGISVTATFLGMFFSFPPGPGTRPVCPHCDTKLFYKDSGFLDIVGPILLLLGFVVAGVITSLCSHVYTGDGLGWVFFATLLTSWALVIIWAVRYLRRHKRLVIARR
jgi:serine/threonine protein kinase